MENKLPPAWLFRKSIVIWLAEPVLFKQLPIIFLPLSLYCYIYFRIQPDSNILKGGRHILHFLSRIYRFFGGSEVLEMQIGGDSVFINILDPRFLQVVNEIRGMDLTRILKFFLSEGDTFIDIGANQGGFSVVASHLVGGGGRVIAIEPQKHLAEVVYRSLERSPACFDVYNIALGDREELVDFILPLSYSGTAGLFPKFSGKNGFKTTKVQMRRCDSVIDWQKISGRTFIKLDVEGAEGSVLHGACELIKALKPNILIEINPEAMQAANVKPEEFLGIIKMLGYRNYLLTSDLSTLIGIDDLQFHGQLNVVLVN